jgi:hypothetical protein
MNRRLTPDQKAGLSVTGLLLVIVAMGLGIAGYCLYGVPQWPMPQSEMAYAFGAAAAAFVGVCCLYKGTDATSR